MPEIVLTEEQAKVLAGATTAVVVRAPNGAAVGALDPKDAEIIAEAKRRLAKPGPRYSGTHIQARLQALNAERERIGSFDEAYMWAFLDQLERSDPATYGPKSAPE